MSSDSRLCVSVLYDDPKALKGGTKIMLDLLLVSFRKYRKRQQKILLLALVIWVALIVSAMLGRRRARWLVAKREHGPL